MKDQIVQCRHCGHESPADYRFCGMCGRPVPEPALPVPTRVKEPEEVYLPDLTERRARSAERSESPSATSISGPSFLGIGDQPSTPEFSYLLEDEPNRGPGRVLLALIIILGLGAAGWWQVHRHGGRQWLYAVIRNPKLLTQSAKAEDGLPADRLNRSTAALMESSSNPNASKETDLQVQGQTLVPKDGEPVETKKADSQPSANNSAESNTKESENPVPKHVNAEEAVRKQPASENEATASNQQDNDGTEAAVRKQPAEDRASTKPTPRSGLEQTNAKESTSGVDDSNIRLAEKYLYGQGVRQNCGRALNLLRPAAESSNPKARSLLGTMYATGHCVPRDLASSYRWFALSLREQPNNVWVSRNLQSVWNQMSDSEKQTAMRMTK